MIRDPYIDLAVLDAQQREIHPASSAPSPPQRETRRPRWARAWKILQFVLFDREHPTTWPTMVK